MRHLRPPPQKNSPEVHIRVNDMCSGCVQSTHIVPIKCYSSGMVRSGLEASSDCTQIWVRILFIVQLFLSPHLSFLHRTMSLTFFCQDSRTVVRTGIIVTTGRIMKLNSVTQLNSVLLPLKRISIISIDCSDSESMRESLMLFLRQQPHNFHCSFEEGFNCILMKNLSEREDTSGICIAQTGSQMYETDLWSASALILPPGSKCVYAFLHVGDK